MEHRIYSPGKLLITSEYFVLDGALALAVPTKLGQDFYWQEKDDNQALVRWEALHEGKAWLSAKIDYKNWKIIETNIPESADFVVKVLKNVQSLSKLRFQNNSSYFIRTNLQFPANFGLGSSSTLMNNLAEFSDIDAFLLNELSLGGSGYDIAVAQEKTAILYQNKPRVMEKVVFNPDFLDELIFVHLNQKQDSREGIQLYRSKNKTQDIIKEFSNLTLKILNIKNLDDFSNLMNEHEKKVSEFLGIETIQQKYFPDYGGFVKSLGAWGGDFVLASKFGDYKNYFLSRNYPNVFSWNDLIY